MAEVCPAATVGASLIYSIRRTYAGFGADGVCHVRDAQRDQEWCRRLMIERLAAGEWFELGPRLRRLAIARVAA